MVGNQFFSFAVLRCPGGMTLLVGIPSVSRAVVLSLSLSLLPTQRAGGTFSKGEEAAEREPSSIAYKSKRPVHGPVSLLQYGRS